ncbi:hypothetical protein [Geoalkalibacter halelectricus]|uniref:Uncharacterized protein n=1 Tax=Geoalkalibacter halelectricus TaxID=2847045 RepID=A0ABY5ZM85_9BACT|nr:hypothetical protein [Geoalkalibacter halelectricus]MDO3378733.1 hypothetical protein [Geoalkalibacter halelectricus]UWZ79959.1 hypothetical protein L9S41_00830 [Geoalkalibacter halelectricus]
MQTRKLAFLTALLLSAAMLWGCGSSGSGGTDVTPIDPADVQTVGIFNCSTCHAGGPQVAKWLDSKHAAGSYGDTRATCLRCHDPDGDGVEALQAFGIDRQNVVGCESCHGGGSAHRGLGPLPFPAPGDAQCAQCHSALTVAAAGTHLGNNPFSNIISERFAASPKGNPRQRINNSESGCRACHSHQGAVAYLSIDQKITTYGDMATAVGTNGVISVKQRQLYPEGWDGDESAMKRCTTCHDAHSGAIRGLGDQTAAGLGLDWEDDLGVDLDEIDITVSTDTGPAPQDRVVFSAEFNLCTACHMVDLKVTYNPDAGYNDGGMFEYALADIYGTVDADTRDEIDYHARRADGTPAFSRTMSNTHFAGTLSAFFGDFAGPVTGYGVNPASPNACTSCHDPHSNNKFEGEMARAFAEGIGKTHGNYFSNAFSYESTSCTPCHTGREFPKLTFSNNLAQGLDRIGSPRWNALGCVSCHDMAVGADGDVTQPRDFQDAYVFEFKSAVSDDTLVDVDDLVRVRNDITYDNRTCFECHKGRDGLKANFATTAAQVFNVSYLHYKAQFPILFGMVDVMIPGYEGKVYTEGLSIALGDTDHVGRADRSTCVGCHSFHTENPGTFHSPGLATGFNCTGCHTDAPSDGITTTRSFETLRDRTKVFAEVLLETILDELAIMFDDGDFDSAEYPNLTEANQSDIAAIIAGTNHPDVTEALAEYLERESVLGEAVAQGGTLADQKARLKKFITGSTRDATGSRMITNQLAIAGAIWKNFMYDDKGGWAHNSILARELMYDAIEDINPDNLVNLSIKAAEFNVPIGDGTGRGELMRGLDQELRPLPVPEL